MASISQIKIGNDTRDIYAIRLKTASNIKLTGAVTGNVSFTGAGGDVTINTTVNHTHSYLPLSGGTLSGPLNFSNNSSISWNKGTYQQRIAITDANTKVFSFQQSSDSGSNWTELMRILDNGAVYATSFNGNVAWSNITGKPSTFTPASHTHKVTYKKSATTTGAATQEGTVAKTSITPAGTISQPTFTGTAHSHTFTGTRHSHTLTPTTSTVNSITSVGTMFAASVTEEVLTLTPGTVPSYSGISVYTGLTMAEVAQDGSISETTAAGTVSTPTFTGTAAEHTHTFTGASHSHSITLTDTTVTSTSN